MYFSDAEEQPVVDGVSLIYYILYHERLENTISSCFCRLYNLHYEKFADGSVKCIEDEIPFELPDGWAWARVNQIYNFIDYRGATPNKITSGVPLITAKNVKSGYKLERLENRKKYLEKGERTKRTHRLCNLGGTIESLAPEVKDLTRTEMTELMEHIFSLSEVQRAVRHMAITHTNQANREKELKADGTISSERHAD